MSKTRVAPVYLVQDPSAKNVQNHPNEAYLSVKLIEKIKESASLGGAVLKSTTGGDQRESYFQLIVK